MRLLIIGAGDVARRFTLLAQGLPPQAARPSIFALCRHPEQFAELRALGIVPIFGDLDKPESLRRLRLRVDAVLHLVPPPTEGLCDTRTGHLIQALRRGAIGTARLIYVSTTGVYGNCSGAWIDETTPLQPTTPRAQRRVSAEVQLRRWAAKSGVRMSILRVPGIYAEDRLPLDRIKSRLPVLAAEEDVFTNHIHADDLAAVLWQSLRLGRANRVVNVTDGLSLKMGDWFDACADKANLPRPPRMPRAAIKTSLSPMQYSFMQESRRIKNVRLTSELKFTPLRRP